MEKTYKQAVSFLKAYQMDIQDVNIDDEVASFLAEMERGLCGKKSSLEMIPTYIEAGGQIPSNKPVIVIDAGGTNFRTATVYFDDQKKPVIENLKLYPMPGVQEEIGKEAFFKTIAGYLRPVAGLSDRIGFCFSYPVQMQPDKDGRLIRFCKEIKAEQVVGHLIGDCLNQAIAAAGLGPKKQVVLLNDTVVTLLAGVGFGNRDFSSYIGFILGTGTNSCYSESNKNIRKTPNLDRERSMIVNIESGNFGRGHRGKLDVAFDKTTSNPGVQKFEKMISGGYLGALCHCVYRQACKDKLLSASTCQAIGSMANLTTKEVNTFMLYPAGDNPLANACKSGNPDDVQILYAIADRMIERAAKLTAVNLSATAIRCGYGKDPTRPICIVAEGTTFYHMKTLKSRVEFYLKQYLENKRGIYTETIHIDNATLVGAAIAGLTN